jgi:nitrite reductase (NADH) small subunit
LRTPIPICSTQEFNDGDCMLVTVDDRDVAIFKQGDQYYAIDDRCPHAGASLSSGHVENGIVTCPWHAWRFRLSDGAWADNPRVKTNCYKVTVENDQVLVHPNEKKE